MASKEIWVVCVNMEYELDPILQLINKAYDLARSKEMNSVAVCIGENDEKTISLFAQNGADSVLEAKYKGNDKTEVAEILKQMIKKYEPEMIMFPGESMGKYLASVCATTFQAGLTADCVDISLSADGDFIFSRAALNDSVIANIKVVNSNIKMCTVKKNAFLNKNYVFKKECKVIDFNYDININSNKIVVLERDEAVAEENDSNWKSANVVFGIGRGVVSKTYVDYIFKLAHRYGAAVVGTRAIVEAGILEEKRQVGQSGHSISPDIYIAFGISGACQHIVGIKNAKTIIAINKDEKAAIFDYADYKIVNSVESIIDEWIKVL